MEKVSKNTDLSIKIKTALDKAVKKIITEQKAKDGYLITGDDKGNIKKIPATDL
jgi:hypothetical protein